MFSVFDGYACMCISRYGILIKKEEKWTAFRDFFKWLKSMFFLYHTSRRSMFFSRSTPKPCCWGAHLAWGRKINWSQIVWSRKWYKIKNCSFCIISLSRMHYFKNWSLILKGNEALQPTNHLWAQFFPWQVHNSQKCIFVIFWHSHLVVVSGDHVQKWPKVPILTLYVTIERNMTKSTHFNIICHNWMKIDQKYTF